VLVGTSNACESVCWIDMLCIKTFLPINTCPPTVPASQPVLLTTSEHDWGVTATLTYFFPTSVHILLLLDIPLVTGEGWCKDALCGETRFASGSVGLNAHLDTLDQSLLDDIPVVNWTVLGESVYHSCHQNYRIHSKPAPHTTANLCHFCRGFHHGNRSHKHPTTA